MSKTVYRDPTPVGTEEQELKDVRVSPLTAKYTKYIREKEMGVDVRESIARGIEAIEFSTNDRVENLKVEVTPEITQNVLEEVAKTNATAEVVAARKGIFGENSLLGGRISEIESSMHNYDVTSFGIHGDGETDISIKFQELILIASSAGGGVIWMPKGKYVVGTIIRMRSNIKIIGEDGTTIVSKVPNSVIFHYPSFSKGYEGGVSNVEVRNIKFQGNFSAGTCKQGINQSMHHAKNVLYSECIFMEAHDGCHTFDICGCKNITIDNCKFYGFNPISGREYAECIQLDYSAKLFTSHKDEIDEGNYDGLPCENIEIKNNEFLPIKDDDGFLIHPAANGVGAHTNVGDIPHRSISITNNYISDTQDVLESQLNWSFIHIPLVDGLLIQGNTFEGNNSLNSKSFIALYNLNNFVDISTVNDDSISYINAGTMRASERIVIRGNVFRDVKTLLKMSIITIKANNGNPKHNDIKISENYFSNLMNDKTVPGANEITGVNIVNCNMVEVNDNDISRISRFIYVSGGEDYYVFRNRINVCNYGGFVFSDNVSRVSFTDNVALSYIGAVATFGSSVRYVLITNNNFTYCSGMFSGYIFGENILYFAGENFTISNNRFSGNKRIDRIIRVQTGAKNGIISTNFLTEPKTEAILNNGVNISESNNI